MWLNVHVDPKRTLQGSSKTCKCSCDSQRTVPYSEAALTHDLMRVRAAWKRFQSSRNRDAVYDYLTAVFELVSWWMEERQVYVFSGHALYLHGYDEMIEVDPFAAVILSTSNPKKVDLRTRSKFSRALRYAAAVKRPSEPLRQFMQRKGGINECASRFARRRRRCQ
jgi:hypothetical protein